jgi:hypothetical protein
MQLTNKERDDTAKEVNQALEEVDDELDDLRRELCSELDRVLNEVAGGGEEGPDELDHRGDEVGHCVDDRRHLFCSCVCCKVLGGFERRGVKSKNGLLLLFARDPLFTCLRGMTACATFPVSFDGHSLPLPAIWDCGGGWLDGESKDAFGFE